MTIRVFTCDCHGAEPLARQVLQKAKVPNWMDFYVEHGKEHAITILSYMPEDYTSSLQHRALIDHIKEKSSFVVIVGYDDAHFYWSDIYSNAPADVAQAVAILKRFA